MKGKCLCGVQKEEVLPGEVYSISKMQQKRTVSPIHANLFVLGGVKPFSCSPQENTKKPQGQPLLLKNSMPEVERGTELSNNTVQNFPPLSLLLISSCT